MLVPSMKRALALLLAASAAFAAEDLVKTLGFLETQLFIDWQKKRLDSFQNNIADDAVAWSGYGVIDKKTQLDFQKRAEDNCTVRSFELYDLRVLTPEKSTAILVYNVRQDATCGGRPVPSPLTNATTYVKRKGKWQVVFRASQPLVAPAK